MRDLKLILVKENRDNSAAKEEAAPSKQGEGGKGLFSAYTPVVKLAALILGLIAETLAVVVILPLVHGVR